MLVLMETAMSCLAASCLVGLPPGARAAERSPLNGSYGVELARHLSADAIYWPLEKTGFVREAGFGGETAKGYSDRANQFFAPKSGGQHPTIGTPRP